MSKNQWECADVLAAHSSWNKMREVAKAAKGIPMPHCQALLERKEIGAELGERKAFEPEFAAGGTRKKKRQKKAPSAPVGAFSPEVAEGLSPSPARRAPRL